MTAELTEAFRIALLVLLIAAALAAALMKRLVPALVAFTSFSLVLSVLWVLLEAPDLAITEAAVGAGVSGVLFYAALHRMGQIKRSLIEKNSDETDDNGDGGGQAPESEAHGDEDDEK